MKVKVVDTQNILSIREDTLSCEAERPKFTKDAVMSEYSDVSEKSYAAWKGKYTLNQTRMLLPQLYRHVVYLLRLKKNWKINLIG